MKQKIIQRILADSGVPDLLEILARRLSPTDLQSLMLQVYRERASVLNPADLFRQYEGNRFVRPPGIDPVTLLEFDRLAFSLLPSDFEALTLSPVTPLGSNSVIATVAQNNAVTTSRNTEVCSDSTNVLALECARRRLQTYRNGKKPEADTRLCSSQRLLRPQFFDTPGFFPHFHRLDDKANE